MDADALKQRLRASLQRARHQSMHFAVALGKQVPDHRLSLHVTQSGRAQAKVLKEETGFTLVTWGMTEVDPKRPETLVLVLESRVLSGLGKKLQAWLKLMGTPIKKVVIKVDGQELPETDDADADADSVASQSATPTKDRAEDPAAAWRQLLAAMDKLKPLLAQALQHPDTGPQIAKLQVVIKKAHQQQALPQAQKALKLIVQQVQQFKQLPAAAKVQTTPPKDLPQVVQGLPEGLGEAIFKMASLQADPELAAERQQFKQQGKEVQSLVLQLREATLKKDPAKVRELKKQVEAKRKKTREQLKALIPPKGIPKDQGKEAWVGLVARLDLSSPRDGAVFWSGDKDNAIDLAMLRKGTSLESTSGGCLVDDWRIEGVPWSEKEGDGPPFMKDLWQLMSASYAMQAEGDIAIVQTPEKHALGGGEMWRKVEKGILLEKAMRGQIRFAPTIVREPLPNDSETGKP